MNGTTQVAAEYFDDRSRCLVEDVTSLERVRNRLSRSSDERLHIVIPMLIPKLYQRVENYKIIIAGDNENGNNSEQSSLDASTLSTLEKAQHHIYGIICSAMERFRGNESIPTDSLVRAMLPFVESDNSAVGTWTLAFLKASIQRTPVTNSSLISTLIPALSESVGRLHKRIAQLTEISANDSSLEARWINAS